MESVQVPYGTLKLRQPRTIVPVLLELQTSHVNTLQIRTKSCNSGGTISKIMYMLAPQIIAN